MFEITIEIRGPLRKPNGKVKFNFSCKKGDKVQDLLKKLGYLDLHIPSILVIQNGKLVRHSAFIANNDHLILQTVASGG